MSIQAFQPLGNTITFTAAVSPPTAVQAKAGGSNQPSDYRIINGSTTQTVFLGVGATAAIAANNAVTFSSNNASCIPLLPGTDEILTFGPSFFFTGAAGANAVVYITPGEGV
jgi:hypothetical protein